MKDIDTDKYDTSVYAELRTQTYSPPIANSPYLTHQSIDSQQSFPPPRFQEFPVYSELGTDNSLAPYAQPPYEAQSAFPSASPPAPSLSAPPVNALQQEAPPPPPPPAAPVYQQPGQSGNMPLLIQKFPGIAQIEGTKEEMKSERVLRSLQLQLLVSQKNTILEPHELKDVNKFLSYSYYQMSFIFFAPPYLLYIFRRTQSRSPHFFIVSGLMLYVMYRRSQVEKRLEMYKDKYFKEMTYSQLISAFKFFGDTWIENQIKRYNKE